ncbi:YeiH family protein [Rummeliibacillus sp. TYF-LIM-RU47]|uniref:YeiH family protein n=1 Tax=Rummeliibacillus sp. TYF-LIM-RU47 TaxID=2608406 RepID=UPI00123C31C0|nr:putative sulfate exporter family transporter [Rummeliibacillus sp. TYF-LIM-RU47]
MKHNSGFYKGILMVLIIAIASYFLSKVPMLNYLGPLAIAILIAVIIRNTLPYPQKWKTGIDFAAKKILRFAIIMYGIRLNIAVVAHEGLPLIARAAGVIVGAILLTIIIGKLLKVEDNLMMLLAFGTGICGAAAIAAISPILKAKEEDTAMAVGMIALMGTIFSLLYPAVGSLLHLAPAVYGYWSGFSLHEIAHAALAGAAYGDESLTPALLSKLSRVLLLFPVTLVLVGFLKFKKGGTGQKASFPYFLLGFLAVSALGTWGTQQGFLSASVEDAIAQTGTFFLAVAMAALGMSVDLKELKSRALKPLLMMTIVSIILSGAVLFIV